MYSTINEIASAAVGHTSKMCHETLSPTCVTKQSSSKQWYFKTCNPNPELRLEGSNNTSHNAIAKLYTVFWARVSWSVVAPAQHQDAIIQRYIVTEMCDRIIIEPSRQWSNCSILVGVCNMFSVQTLLSSIRERLMVNKWSSVVSQTTETLKWISDQVTRIKSGVRWLSANEY